MLVLECLEARIGVNQRLKDKTSRIFVQNNKRKTKDISNWKMMQSVRSWIEKAILHTTD